MKVTGIDKLSQAGRWLLLPALALTLVFATSCEDDPIVEPKGQTKTGGSYGGRLTQPQESAEAEKAAPGSQKANRRNPEVY